MSLDMRVASVNDRLSAASFMVASGLGAADREAQREGIWTAACVGGCIGYCSCPCCIAEPSTAAAFGFLGN